MVLCALGILSVFVYLLLGGIEVFRPSSSVYVYLKDLSGLEKASAVQFNGIRVGEVSRVALSGLRDPNKVVRVDMVIRIKYLDAIPEDSTVAVTALNVLDDQFVNINEGKSSRHLMPGAELRASPPPTIDPAQIFAGGRKILEQLDAVVHDMETGQGNVGSLVKGEEVYDSMLGKVSKFQTAVKSATDKNSLTGQLIFDDALYNRIEDPVKRLNRMLSDLQAGQGSVGKLLQNPAQYEQIRKSVADLNRVLADMNSGKSAGGKLLKDDALYRRVNQLVETLIRQVDALNSGEGALGPLLANSSLYESLLGSTQSLQQMLKALRENPKKMLRPKIF